MEHDFVIYTIIPFLTPRDIVNYLALNRYHRSFDTKRLWKRCIPSMINYSRRIVKKAVHFEYLANKHSGITLFEEIRTTEQWDVIRAVLITSKVPKTLLSNLQSVLYHCFHIPKMLKQKLKYHYYKRNSYFEEYFMLRLKNWTFKQMYKLRTDGVVNSLQQYYH